MKRYYVTSHHFENGQAIGKTLTPSFAQRCDDHDPHALCSKKLAILLAEGAVAEGIAHVASVTEYEYEALGHGESRRSGGTTIFSTDADVIDCRELHLMLRPEEFDRLMQHVRIARGTGTDPVYLALWEKIGRYERETQ